MSPEPQIRRALDFAVGAARAAGAIVMRYFQTDLAVETKSDASPVTIADRRAEEEIRRLIAAEFPEDGILGEEFGEKRGTSGRRWILDPVDGTKSFIHGVPLFGVLIGLEDRGKSVVGVVYLPALQEMVYAGRGCGCWWLPAGHAAGSAPRRAQVSSVPRLSESLFVTTAAEYFERAGKMPVLERLRKAVKLERWWGDCYAHVLVATGRAELAVEASMHIWDNAPLMPILLEAGGTFTDWRGNFVIDSSEAMSTNGKVLEETLRLVQP
jgi:histidinol phosphatase-like enzyme (inositol monophosphatase family)